MVLLWLLLATFAHAGCKDHFAHISPAQRAKRLAEVRKEIEGHEPPYITSWSFTAQAESGELGPGVRRVGPEKISYDRKRGTVEILLPSGRKHTVHLTGKFISPETQEVVANFLALVPEKYVHLLREIHVPKADPSLRFTDAFVDPVQPAIIYLQNQTRLNLGEVLSHEFGHVSDRFHTYRMPWQRGAKNLRKEWQQAAAQDGKSISTYGDTQALEDFAEAVARYLEPNETLRQSFRTHFPHRAKFLDEYFAATPGNHDLLHSGYGKIGVVIGVPGALIVAGSWQALRKLHEEGDKKPASQPETTAPARRFSPAPAILWH